RRRRSTEFRRIFLIKAVASLEEFDALEGSPNLSETRPSRSGAPDENSSQSLSFHLSTLQSTNIMVLSSQSPDMLRGGWRLADRPAVKAAIVNGGVRKGQLFIP